MVSHLRDLPPFHHKATVTRGRRAHELAVEFPLRRSACTRGTGQPVSALVPKWASKLLIELYGKEAIPHLEAAISGVGLLGRWRLRRPLTLYREAVRRMATMMTRVMRADRVSRHRHSRASRTVHHGSPRLADRDRIVQQAQAARYGPREW
jgi:hypothetical protein